VEPGIPEDKADGELVWGTSRFRPYAALAPVEARSSRSSSSIDLIPARAWRGGKRSSTSDYMSAISCLTLKEGTWTYEIILFDGSYGICVDSNDETE
jgi:hypothetical protein